jgi:hypothetical protein
MNSDDKPTVRSTTQARQGVTIHAMRYVLGVGIAGVVAGLLVAWYVMGA